jgi:hypothetical protein
MRAGDLSAWVCLRLCTCRVLHHQAVRACPTALGWAGGVLTCRMLAAGLSTWACLCTCCGCAPPACALASPCVCGWVEVECVGCLQLAGGRGWVCALVAAFTGSPCARVALRVDEWHWGRGVSDAGRLRVRVGVLVQLQQHAAPACARASPCVWGWMGCPCVGWWAIARPRGCACARVATCPGGPCLHPHARCPAGVEVP